MTSSAPILSPNNRNSRTPNANSATTPMATDPSPVQVLNASVEAPDTNNPATTFPHPSTFTFIPDLYNLISRLSILQNAGNATNSTTTINGSDNNNSSTEAQPNTNNNGTPSPTATREKPPSEHSPRLTKTSSKESIEIKNLPSLLYSVRQAIQNAKDVVGSLPDIERGVEEQEREIKQLKGRLVGLRERLSELGELANVDIDARGQQDGDIMQGIEEKGSHD